MSSAASLYGHSNGASNYVKGRNFRQGEGLFGFSRIMLRLDGSRSLVGRLPVWLILMACGILLDRTAFMFRVTDPGDELRLFETSAVSIDMA